MLDQIADSPNPWLFELFKTLLIVIGTVGVGQAIVASWQMRNKRRELDIETSLQFQQMYGEFKDIWRIWKVLRGNKAVDLLIPEDARFELLKRATAAESKVEAIVVKLAVERQLSESQITDIGLFRQGFQRLRQKIRDNKKLDFNYTHPEYRLFNERAAAVAGIILSEAPRKPPDGRLAAKHLEAISKIRKKHWKEAMAKFPPYPKEDGDEPEEESAVR